jgi:hypothetical protein
VLSQSTIPVVVTEQGPSTPGQGTSTSTVLVPPPESGSATPAVGSTSWGMVNLERDALLATIGIALLTTGLLLVLI